MKKTILAFAVLAAMLTLVSCSKKADLVPFEVQAIKYQHENITVTVDPKTELLLVALRLTEQEPFNENRYGQEYSQYIDGIDKVCEKQKNHPFVKTLKSNYDPKKMNPVEILKICRFISDDLTSISITKKELPVEMQDFWKKINLNKFLAEMNDFAVQSNFARVWLLYNSQLKSQAINVLDYYKSLPQITNWVSDFFFAENNKPDYEFFATTATAAYMYIPTMAKKDNKNIIQNYVPAFVFDKDNAAYSLTPALYLAYGVAYTYTTENWDLVSESYGKLLDKIIEENHITYKYSDSEKRNFFANLMSDVCVLNYEVAKNDEEIATQFINQIVQYFYYKEPEKLISLVDVYINNRNQYSDFETFFKEFIPAALKDL